MKKIVSYLKRTRIICRFIERLETIPIGVWRLFQACYNLIVLFLLIGGIAWGIKERKVLRENQRSGGAMIPFTVDNDIAYRYLMDEFGGSKLS